MKKCTALLTLFLLHTVHAAQQKVELFFTENGNSAGFIAVEETRFGLLFTPALSGFTEGMHGFHIHEHPSCDHNAMDALGHLDPKKTGKHQGPYQTNGHLGDLPQLFADKKGDITSPVLAPRLRSLKTIRERTLLIHANPDNYSDVPEKLGGSGARTACGVVKIE